MDASLKCRRLDPSSIRSVEGDAEWKLYNAGLMRAHFLKYLGCFGSEKSLRAVGLMIDGDFSSSKKKRFPPLTRWSTSVKHRGWRWRHQYWCHFVDAFLRRGRHGQCECQHFQLPGFPEVQFTWLGKREKGGGFRKGAVGQQAITFFFWMGVLVFAVFWSLFWCWRSHFRSWKYISSCFFLPLPDPVEQKIQGMRTIIIAKLNHRMDPLSSSLFSLIGRFDGELDFTIAHGLLHPGSQVHVVPLGF